MANQKLRWKYIRNIWFNKPLWNKVQEYWEYGDGEYCRCCEFYSVEYDGSGQEVPKCSLGVFSWDVPQLCLGFEEDKSNEL